MDSKDTFVSKIYISTGITKEDIFKNKRVVHLGCGKSKLNGVIGIDALEFQGVDIVHDLNTFPWPLKDSSVDVIFAHSVLEHLNSLSFIFEEIWRVGKDGARVVIAVPYFRSVDAFGDPTHRIFFTAQSLDYFMDVPNSRSEYDYIKHKLKKIGFWYGWPKKSKNPLTRLFKKFIHAHPKFYDQYLSLLFPVKILVWELEVSK